MGSYFSRNTGEVEELNINSNTAYRYPPKSGNYFGTHFIMGGTKFETMQPEAYLFGENSDLNFLGPKPYNCPYQVSSPSQPVRALRCLVNIRKDSLRLVKVPSALNKTVTNEEHTVDQDRQITAEEGEGEGPFLYNIEFTFDADCPCSITIYYNATEEMVNKNVIYSPQPTRDCTDTVHFNAGCNQQFCLPTHRIDPAKLAVSDIDWTKGYTKIPIVIQVCADCGPTVIGHSHITYAEFYKPSDNTWSIRAVKQKQAIDGVCYLLQEIYGIENKNVSSRNLNENDEDDDDDLDDDNSECVVCLSESRDTLILPCKHLCLCSSCANQLRYQQSGCPICRQSFRALLQIRAVRKKTAASATTGGEGSSQEIPSTVQRSSDDQSNADENEEEARIVPVPDGYEVVPLIEAIKGSIGATPKSTAPSDQPSVSASADNITVVDETAPACSGISSMSGSVTKVLDSDSESEIEEVTIIPQQSKTPSVKNVSESPVKDVPAQMTDDVEDEEENATCNDTEDDDMPSHTYAEIPLPGVAEVGAESGDSQNSTKELLPHHDEAEESDIVVKDKKEVKVYEEMI